MLKLTVVAALNRHRKSSSFLLYKMYVVLSPFNFTRIMLLSLASTLLNSVSFSTTTHLTLLLCPLLLLSVDNAVSNVLSLHINWHVAWVMYRFLFLNFVLNKIILLWGTHYPLTVPEEMRQGYPIFVFRRSNKYLSWKVSLGILYHLLDQIWNYEMHVYVDIYTHVWNENKNWTIIIKA